MNKTRKSPQRVPRTASFVVAVQKEIERLIGSGELQGGSRINESAMAQKLSVSRGPIREACRTLEQQGLLRSELNRGFFVREIGVTVIAALHDLNPAAMFCDRLCLMDRGRVVALGTAEDELTPAPLGQVYGVDATIQRHPRTGTVWVLPG